MGSIAVKVNAAGKKTKYYADKVYLYGLVFFLASQACALASTVSEPFYNVLFFSGTVLLAIAGIYRIFFTLFEDRKTGLIALSAVMFGLVYFIYSVCTVYSNDALIFLITTVAIAGAVKVNADHILITGIIGNAVMVINNIYVSIIRTDTLAENLYSHNDFFYFGKNEFYFHRMNNRSSTDWASHYFWIIVAYLWIRGRKLTWGEVLAVGGLDILVYALTGSNTSLICITLALFAAVVFKLDMISKEHSGRTLSSGSVHKENVLVTGIIRLIDFCSKYSFVILAALMILLALMYDIGKPWSYKLNLLLHERLSLGQRGIIENGMHLFSSGVDVYGNYSNVDNYYNFIDCSYLSVLVRMGILPFVFYLGSLTAVQLKHKKYLFGAVLLAVCALSCIEEHHLAEVPYNFFVLLLLADFDKDKTIAAPAVIKKKNKELKRNIVAAVLTVIFVASAVFISYPRYKAVKECDRLDEKASEIYRAVQTNLDNKFADGIWQEQTALMCSDQYGEALIDEPYGFHLVTGENWADVNRDPKVHAYYSVYFDARNNDDAYKICGLLITDDVRELMGGGSVVIEYDVAAGKVYAVWYSERPGCHSIVTGRLSDRADRLMMKEGMEGYSTGGANV